MKGVDDAAIGQGPESSRADWHLRKGGGSEGKFHDQVFTITIKSCLAELLRLVTR